MKEKRNIAGDLTLPFFGFVLVAALTIASLTSISQYNIMVEKLNAGLDEANKASVKYILDNVSDSALIGTLSPAVLAELANARTAGIAAAENSLSDEIKDLIATRNGSANVFDIADSSITKDASDNVIIQFAVEAQVLPPPTPKYKRVFKKVVAKPFSLNSREVCTELDCPPGDCGDCGACDDCTGKCVPDFSIPDGQGGFKNPDTLTATEDNIACSLNDPCAVIGDGWETYEEHGITGCIKDNCKYLPNHHTVNRSTESIGGGFFAQPGSKFRVGVRPECDPSTGCTQNIFPTMHFITDTVLFTGQPLGFTDVCIDGNVYSIGPETTMSDLSDNSDDPGEQTYSICTDPRSPDPDEYVLFITAGRYPGNFGGVAAANNYCQTDAANAGLANSASYQALFNGFTGGVDVSAGSIVNANAQFFKADGTVINKCPLLPRYQREFNEYPLASPINQLANGFTVSPAGPLAGFLVPHNPDAGVWTGYLDTTGSASVSSSGISNCDGWTSIDVDSLALAEDFQVTDTWLGHVSVFSFYTIKRCDGTTTGPDTSGYRFYCVGPR